MYGQNPMQIAAQSGHNSDVEHQGFGTDSAQNVQELMKALEARDITGRTTDSLTTASGAPLKVESLENTLKITTYQEYHIRMWNAIPKKPAFNTVEEFNTLTSYGDEYSGGFNLEGELPSEEDSTYVRKSELVKFLGNTRSVTHPMQLVSTHIGDVVARETRNGTLWILKKLDRSLAWGSEKLIPAEFNGIYAQQEKDFTNISGYYNSNVIIDLRGQRLTEEAIEQASNTLVENFARPDMLFAPPKVLSNFVKEFYGNKYIPVNTDAITNGTMGQRINTFASQMGDIALHHDLFLNRRPAKTTATAATSVKAPAAPTATSVTPVASDAESQWAASDAGDYFFAVSAINRHGESALTVLNPGAAATIATGGAADLAFTATTSPNPTNSFVIYRSNEGAATPAAATFYPLFQVSTGELSSGYDGGAAGVIRDRNRFMPNTDQCFMLQGDNEVWEFGQLAPLMKMDLAVLGPAIRWMILLYGTPFLYAPRKMVRFINVGTN